MGLRQRSLEGVDKASGAGDVLHVAVIAIPSVDQQRALNEAEGGQQGAGCVLRVIRKRVAPAKDEGYALSDRHRLKKLHHISVGGAQDADVINVDDHVSWKTYRKKDILAYSSSG